MFRFQGVTWYFLCACAVIVVSHFKSVESRPNLEKIVIQPDFRSDEDRVKETITVQQHTSLSRRRREAGYQDEEEYVDFPDTMDFTFNFKHGEVIMQLKRNEYMTSYVKLSSDNGPMEHNLGQKTGIYKNLENKASFVIQCDDFLEHCAVRGSMVTGGQTWDIKPDGEIPQTHTAIQKPQGLEIRFGDDALPIPDDVDETEMQIYSNTDGRQKRDIPIPTQCYIVECQAFVDESVFNYFLTKSGNNAATARSDIMTEYMVLYAMADLHFDYVANQTQGECIRLFLAGVNIQTLSVTSWSKSFESNIGGVVYVNAGQGCQRCGQICKPFVEAKKADLCQCFTRKDLIWNGASGTLMAYYRSLAYKKTVCFDNRAVFRSSVIETYGDKVELLIARDVGHGLGSDNDGDNGCSNNDRYIMSDRVVISPDDSKLDNIWYFSTCSINQIFTYLNRAPVDCLKENMFNATSYDTFKSTQLGGQIFSWADQCQTRLGLDSVRCDPANQGRTFLPDMCDRGIYCTNNETDGSCVLLGRPLEGTPCGAESAYCQKGQCYTPPRGLGGSCAAHSDCSDGNATCDVNTLTCICQDAYFNDSGSCSPKVVVGASCPSNDSCADPNSYCDTGLCTCNGGYYGANNACYQLKCIGESCTSANECKANNSVCSTTCRCPVDHFLDVNTGDCAQTVGVGAACMLNDSCADSNSDCLMGQCTCRDGYYTANNACYQLKCIGDSCSAANECKANNSVCLTTCRCPVGRVLDTNTGDCEETGTTTADPGTTTAGTRSGAICLSSAENRALITSCTPSVTFATTPGAEVWCVNNCKANYCPQANCLSCNC